MPTVTIPDVGDVEFPDSMTADEISKAAGKLHADAHRPNPAQAMLTHDRAPGSGLGAAATATAGPVAKVAEATLPGMNVASSQIGAEHGDAKAALRVATGVDLDRSVYENVRRVGPIALTIASQFIPELRSLGVVKRVATVAAVGAGSEALGQVADAAGGHPNSTGQAVASIGTNALAGAFSEALPALLTKVGKTFVAPTTATVDAAFAPVNAALESKMVDTAKLSEAAQRIQAKYSMMGSKGKAGLPDVGRLPNTAELPSGLRNALMDAANGEPMTWQESQFFKDEVLAPQRNSADPTIRKNVRAMLGELETARKEAAKAAGVADQYSFANTLSQTKKIHDDGDAKALMSLAQPITIKLLKLPMAASRAATDGLLERALANPTYGPAIERTIEYMHDGNSSVAAAALTRILTHIAAEPLSAHPGQPKTMPDEASGVPQ